MNINKNVLYLLISIVSIILISVIYVFYLPNYLQIEEERHVVPIEETIVSNPNLSVMISSIIITSEECIGCDNPNKLLQNIKDKSDLFGFDNISERIISSNSEEGQELIQKYNITKLPTLLISENAASSLAFENVWLDDFGTKEESHFVYTNILPPYLDLQTKELVGFVDVISIFPSNCPNCHNITKNYDYLETVVGMKFSNKTTYSSNSSKGQELIQKYNITKLPTFILSEEASVYYRFHSYWNYIGSEDEGNYIYRDVYPPFFNISDSTAHGFISATILMDENCVDCDETISIYYSIMDLYHITLSNLTFINNSSDEWCSFVTTYDVQYLPTLILSPDVKYYKELNNDWKDYFGSIEEDGSLVHRSFGSSVNTVSNISSCVDV